MARKLVGGFGINDADYDVTVNSNGKQISTCHFYSTWRNMLIRCYNTSYLNRFPSYRGCYVCKEWKYFSKFKAWMEQQDYLGNELDKDLLVKGNKLYSPATCIFISKKLNYFLTESSSARGDTRIGVMFRKDNGKYRARIGGGVKGTRIDLGQFDTEQEAHNAWLTAKLEQAKLLAAEQTDPRIAKALIERYENYEKSV